MCIRDRLKTMLQRLAAPTDKAAAMMESLGVNVRDSNGDMLDAAGVAQELQTKLGGLSSAEKDAAMQTLFGSDASRAALIMTDLGREGIERYTAATNDQTAAQRLAESQMGESERAIEEMKGAVETAAIQIGTALAPVVTDIAGIVGDAAEEMCIRDRDNYVRFCVMPLLADFKAALDRGLLLESEKGDLFFDFDMSELTKADMKERWEAWRIAKDGGFMEADEVRVRENMAPKGLDLSLIHISFRATSWSCWTWCMPARRRCASSPRTCLTRPSARWS